MHTYQYTYMHTYIDKETSRALDHLVQLRSKVVCLTCLNRKHHVKHRTISTLIIIIKSCIVIHLDTHLRIDRDKGRYLYDVIKGSKIRVDEKNYKKSLQAQQA